MRGGCIRQIFAGVDFCSKLSKVRGRVVYVYERRSEGTAILNCHEIPRIPSIPVPVPDSRIPYFPTYP